MLLHRCTRASLLTRDVKSMTKSQKRRYYQKLKKGVGAGGTGGGGAAGEGGAADGLDDETSSTGKGGHSTTADPNPERQTESPTNPEIEEPLAAVGNDNKPHKVVLDKNGVVEDGTFL